MQDLQCTFELEHPNKSHGLSKLTTWVGLHIHSPLVRWETICFQSSLLTETFYLINVLVATIVTLSGIALRVLVGETRSQTLLNSTTAKILEREEKSLIMRNCFAPMFYTCIDRGLFWGPSGFYTRHDFFGKVTTFGNFFNNKEILSAQPWKLRVGHSVVIKHYLTSEAISSKPIFWRCFSFWIMLLISGSVWANGSCPVQWLAVAILTDDLCSNWELCTCMQATQCCHMATHIDRGLVKIM